jgi:hypothetical protein
VVIVAQGRPGSYCTAVWRTLPNIELFDNWILARQAELQAATLPICSLIDLASMKATD